jgi:hypothetical protein
MMDKPPIKGRLENFFGKKKKGKQTTTSAADLLYLSFGWPGLGIPIPTLFFFLRKSNSNSGHSQYKKLIVVFIT